MHFVFWDFALHQKDKYITHIFKDFSFCENTRSYELNLLLLHWQRKLR